MNPTPEPPVPSGGLNIPAITPNFDTPGVSGLTSIASWASAIVIVLGALAVIIGIGMVVFGPRMGFAGAKALGMGGIIGGLFVGGLIALITPGMKLIASWF